MALEEAVRLENEIQALEDRIRSKEAQLITILTQETYTSEQAAQRLRVTTKTIASWCKSTRLEAIYARGEWFPTKEAVDYEVLAIA